MYFYFMFPPIFLHTLLFLQMLYYFFLVSSSPVSTIVLTLIFLPFLIFFTLSSVSCITYYRLTGGER